MPGGDARPSIDKELRAGYRLAAGFAASAALRLVLPRPLRLAWS